MTTIRSMSSVESSFYTAHSSFNSTDELNPIINLNGKSYHLTVYHKKPGLAEEEITQKYLKLSGKRDLEQLLQKNIRVPCKEIKIITSISLDANFTCTVYTNGERRKIPFSFTELQRSKIFNILEKVKNLKSIEQSNVSDLSPSLSQEKNLDKTSLIRIALKERINSFLEQIPAINCKPVGFQNKSNNCGFNSCLQMIVNEPALFSIYTTVASYYAKSIKAEDQECGSRMLSILDYYDQAIEEQKPISEKVSNNLRLAMHYLNKEISPKCDVQEDANEIFMILFSKYEYIVKGEEIIDSLQEYRKAFKNQNLPLKIPSNLEQILNNKIITEDLLNKMIVDERKTGKEKLLRTSLMHNEIEHIVHHKIEKTLQNPPRTDYSTLNEDNILIKKETEFDLKIKFNPNQKDLTLIKLLQSHFSQESIEGSETRKFMKGNNCIEASIIKEDLKFSKLPNYLFINLERFMPNFEDPEKSTKFTNPIEIPEELDARLLNVKGSPAGLHELSSFIVHLGDSPNGGHYIAYRKVQDQWMKCNDGRVSCISKEEMLEAVKNSYICFYRLKRDPTILPNAVSRYNPASWLTKGPFNREVRQID
ncbi:MAG: ubiquitin carboxyl-terminal hydrolase family protein [Candidatus Rhabdochlamydia sp.]